jgi:lysophospholipid acyltransferase (LPLAT)-like uncharacterized protein
MAGAAGRLTARAAAAFGRGVAWYSRAAMMRGSTEFGLEAALPRGPAVWIGWHDGNLLALAVQRKLTGRSAIAFTPPGLSGAAMAGWLEGLDVRPVPLARGARRGLGLRHMEAALGEGRDVLIAVDGPHGPRHHVAAGALWLARSTGVEVRPVGFAAWPAFRLPRWDRLLVPLPGARIAALIGAALPSRWPRQDDAAAEIAATLHRLNAGARERVMAEPNLAPTEAQPWG